MPPSYRIALISHKRPKNVSRPIYKDILEEATWYIGSADDRAEYAKNGAIKIVVSGGLVESRNKALVDAFSEHKDCVMIEDDLRSLREATSTSRKDSVTIDVSHVIADMRRALYMDMREMFYLAGVSPTANEFYFDPNKPYSFTHFIVGSFIYVRLGCELRFDDRFRTKEDYDYTLQHIEKYKGALRLNYIMAEFEHYKNKGGVVDWRNDDVEAESIFKLKRKWKSHIVDNPRRKNEVLIKV